jgi:hypothetical protein
MIPPDQTSSNEQLDHSVSAASEDRAELREPVRTGDQSNNPESATDATVSDGSGSAAAEIEISEGAFRPDAHWEMVAAASFGWK